MTGASTPVIAIVLDSNPLEGRLGPPRAVSAPSEASDASSSEHQGTTGSPPAVAKDGSRPPACCAICFAAMAPDDKTVTLACQHTFHDRCIAQWLSSAAHGCRDNAGEQLDGNLSCPLCRASIPARRYCFSSHDGVFPRTSSGSERAHADSRDMWRSFRGSFSAPARAQGVSNGSWVPLGCTLGLLLAASLLVVAVNFPGPGSIAGAAVALGTSLAAVAALVARCKEQSRAAVAHGECSGSDDNV